MKVLILVELKESSDKYPPFITKQNVAYYFTFCFDTFCNICPDVVRLWYLAATLVLPTAGISCFSCPEMMTIVAWLPKIRTKVQWVSVQPGLKIGRELLLLGFPSSPAVGNTLLQPGRRNLDSDENACQMKYCFESAYNIFKASWFYKRSWSNPVNKANQWTATRSDESLNPCRTKRE